MGTVTIIRSGLQNSSMIGPQPVLTDTVLAAEQVTSSATSAAMTGDPAGEGEFWEVYTDTPIWVDAAVSPTAVVNSGRFIPANGYRQYSATKGFKLAVIDDS